MVPPPQVSGQFTIKTSIGKCSEACVGTRRTFEPYFKPAGATTDEMEVEQPPQCSGCGWTSFNAQIAALGHVLSSEVSLQILRPHWLRSLGDAVAAAISARSATVGSIGSCTLDTGHPCALVSSAARKAPRQERIMLHRLAALYEVRQG